LRNAADSSDDDISASATPPTGDSALSSPTTPRVGGSAKREEKKIGKTIKEGKEADSDDDAIDSDDDAYDEKAGKTWDQVIKTNAARTARQSLALPERPITNVAATAVTTAAPTSPKVETASEKRFKQYSATLLVGAILKKWKRGSSTKRYIWVTPNFGTLIFFLTHHKEFVPLPSPPPSFLACIHFIDE
jgi:hypothetical protein